MALRPAYLVALTVVLGAACGGGGGESQAGAPPTPQTSETSTASGETAPSPDGGAGGEAETTAEDACTRFASLPVLEGDLAEHLATSEIIRGAGDDFQEPPGTELVSFERAFEALVRAPSPEGVEELATYGFTATLFKDDGGGAFLVFNDAIAGRGAGTLVVNLVPARDVWVESPHADSDEGTLAQGAHLLTALGARAYLITGANRCASSAETPCSGSSGMCGGKLRTADAAHYDQNHFTSAHRALRAAFPEGVAVNVHGMEAEGNEGAVISDGTREDRPDALSVALRDAINVRLPSSLRAFSCNDAVDDGLYRPLCGTTNVQGRIDNGSTDACRAASPAGSDRFLHLEQANELRTAPLGSELSDAVIDALAEVIPCTLEGCELDAPACQ